MMVYMAACRDVAMYKLNTDPSLYLSIQYCVSQSSLSHLSISSYRVARKSKPLSSINHIKTRHYDLIFHQFRLQNEHMSVLNILCDLISVVITCCAGSCDMGKINASDKIMSENQKKRKYDNKRYFT